MADRLNNPDNPPYGEKGDFRKITITLPPEAYETLLLDSTRRKIAQEPNGHLSSLLREIVMDYLRRSDRRQDAASGPDEDIP